MTGSMSAEQAAKMAADRLLAFRQAAGRLIGLSGLNQYE